MARTSRSGYNIRHMTPDIASTTDDPGDAHPPAGAADRFAGVVESCLSHLDELDAEIPGARLAWVVDQLGTALGKGWCVAALDAGELMAFRSRWSLLGRTGPGREDFEGPGLTAMPRTSAALLAEPDIDRVLDGGSRVVDHRDDTELGRLLVELELDHMIMAGGADDEGRRWLATLLGEHPVVQPFAARIGLTALTHVALGRPRRSGEDF